MPHIVVEVNPIMSGDDLKQLLDTVKLGLIANKQVMRPDLLNDLKEFVNELRGQPSSDTIHQAYARAIAKKRIGSVNADINIDSILQGISQALDVEERMIGESGSTLIKVLNVLEDRTILLALAARFLNM